MTKQSKKSDIVDVTSFDIDEIPEKDRSKTIISFFRMKSLVIILLILISGLLVFYDKIGEVTFSATIAGCAALYYTGRGKNKDE